jgi:hypothetical protein
MYSHEVLYKSAVRYPMSYSILLLDCEAAYSE